MLIPARNEEKNIGTILSDLAAQDYKNIEILVFDDQSEDSTGEIVREFARSEQRIRLVSSEGLPEGWLGKNHACSVLSGLAHGDFLLFLDADVRIRNNTIGRAVSFAKKHGLSLISIFPKQIIISAGEKVTVPNMNYILLSLLPLHLVMKSGFPSLSAANGQFMFFNANAYRAIHPHELFRADKVEDISTAREMKRRGMKIACLAGDDDMSCRMYNGFRDAVSGFSKNVIAFFGNSFLLAVLFWLITTFGFLAVLTALPAGLFIIYLAVYLLARIFISIASHQNVAENILYIFPLQLTMGIFIYRAFINKHFSSFRWKGRNIK